MSHRDPGPSVALPASPLAAFAERLRQGPLRDLDLLQEQLAELTERGAGGPTSHIEDLERLVQLSVEVMEHFNAFTRELAAVLRNLADEHRQRH